MKKLRFGHIGWLSITTINMALMSALNGIVIYLLKFITDYGINRQLDRMIETAQWMFVLLVVIFVLDTFNTWLKSSYLKHSLLIMKKAYVHRLLEQDITQVQKEKASVYRSHLTNEFDRFQDKYLVNLLQFIRMTLQFIVAVIIVATINLYLVIGAFALLVLFLIITSHNSKPVQKTEAKKSESLQIYTDFVQETLSGFEIIKQHQLENMRLAKFIEKATKVQNDNYLVDVKETHVTALNQFIQSFIIFSLIIAGILFARSTDAGLGSIIVVASSFGNVIWPLQQFSPILTQMKGIMQVLSEFDAQLTKPILNRHLSVDSFQKLEFINADLGYEDDDQAILKQVNLEIHRNEKVLIVGISGAGKSTILKTIRQSITPKTGAVNLDHQNIFELIPIDYFSLFTTVDQIGFVFNGSIKDNLTLFHTLPDELCQKSLRQVGLGDMDLSTRVLNNGSNLSGGQRARLMLARALCLGSQVILCDEIFSNLELDLAFSIEKDLLTLNTTIINVSHIIFKEHLSLYDKIYIVENNTVYLAKNTEVVWKRMILSNPDYETQPS
jgi:ATP-binding cassette, subfamily B, bacterial